MINRQTSSICGTFIITFKFNRYQIMSRAFNRTYIHTGAWLRAYQFFYFIFLNMTMFFNFFKETLEHILCACPALLKMRLKCLRATLFEGLNDVSKADLPALLPALTSYMMSSFSIHKGRPLFGIASDQKVAYCQPG